MDELTVSSEGSDEASGHAVRTRVDPRSGTREGYQAELSALRIA